MKLQNLLIIFKNDHQGQKNFRKNLLINPKRPRKSIRITITRQFITIILYFDPIINISR